MASAFQRSRLPGPLKRPLTVLLIVWRKVIEITTGISIQASAQIGPGLYIGHFGGVIVGAGVVMGAGCNISQNVTIGVGGAGPRRGSPWIGDRVGVAPGAVVAGPIRVGDHVLIGANSLVTRDVPPDCVVLGVPAQIVKDRTAQG